MSRSSIISSFESVFPLPMVCPSGDHSRMSYYSQEYLSLLARTGRIEASKRGRVWFTTRTALEEYRKSVEDS